MHLLYFLNYVFLVWTVFSYMKINLGGWRGPYENLYSNHNNSVLGFNREALQINKWMCLFRFHLVGTGLKCEVPVGDAKWTIFQTLAG